MIEEQSGLQNQWRRMTVKRRAKPMPDVRADSSPDERELRNEIVRLNKIITALMNRAERSTSSQRSDFGMFQTALMLERQVQERTAALEQALHANETINHALQLAKERMEVEINERKRAEDELRQANEALTRLSLQDGLTGISNRRYLDEFLTREWQRAVREKTEVSMIMADVDCFKAYNDTYGHLAGDACLQAVARALRIAAKRACDLVARYGGEEFAIVLPGTDLASARRLAEEARRGVEALRIEHRTTSVATEPPRHVTVSFGVACAVPERDSLPFYLAAAADAALYEAKRSGRNQVVAAMEAEMAPEASD